MSEREIQYGDQVTAFLESGGRSISGEFIAKEQAAGGYWIIRDAEGSLHYIQRYERVVRYSEEAMRCQQKARESLRKESAEWNPWR